jgi:hypothetical protein
MNVAPGLGDVEGPFYTAISGTTMFHKKDLIFAQRIIYAYVSPRLRFTDQNFAYISYYNMPAIPNHS